MKNQIHTMLDHRKNKNIYFILIVITLLLSFAFGGSSRTEVSGLAVLRPISIVIAFFAIATTKKELWIYYKLQIWFLFSIIILIILHLIPLPPQIWHNIPGRKIIIDIFSYTDQQNSWIPLSMIPHETWNSLYFMSTPIAIFFLALNIPSNDDNKIAFLVISIAVASAFIGLLQASGMKLYFYSIVSETPPGIFANRNHQGALLSLILPMISSLLNTNIKLYNNIKYKIIILSSVAIVLIPIVLVTGSRMGLFLFILTSIYTVYSFTNNSNVKISTFKSNIIFKLITFIMFICLLLFVVNIIDNRMTVIQRLDNLYDISRLSVWKQNLNFISEYMPLGSGIGTYSKIYQVHETPFILQTMYSNHAHNELIEIVLTAGIPGLVLIGGFALGFVILASRAWRSECDFRRLGVVVISALVVASVVDYPLRTPTLAAVFALAAVWMSRPLSYLNENEVRRD